MKRNIYSIFILLLIIPLMIGCSGYPYLIKAAPNNILPDIAKRPL
jgi:hypothetical protein